MAWDTEGTKRKILDAATTEFADRGPAGTTIERIAKLAGVNKERVYNYYGGKAELFARVLREQLAAAAQNVPVESLSHEDIGEYAGQLYDYHRDHPALARLLQWEALTFASEVPEEQHRREYYRSKTAVIQAGQDAGALTAEIAPDLLNFLLLSLAGYWAAVPQVARMMTSATTDESQESARRRACVVEAARRLASPTPHLPGSDQEGLRGPLSPKAGVTSATSPSD
jgi:AcrR family transcriptional regulator